MQVPSSGKRGIFNALIALTSCSKAKKTNQAKVPLPDLKSYIKSIGDPQNPFLEELRIVTANNGGKLPDLRCLLATLYGYGEGGRILKSHLRTVKASPDLCKIINNINPGVLQLVSSEKGEEGKTINDIFWLRMQLNLRSGYNQLDYYTLVSPDDDSANLVKWIIEKSKLDDSIDSQKILDILLKLANNNDKETIKIAATDLVVSQATIKAKVKQLTDLISLPVSKQTGLTQS